MRCPASILLAAAAIAATTAGPAHAPVDLEPSRCTAASGLAPAAVATDHLTGPQLDLTALVVVDTGGGLTRDAVAPMIREAADRAFSDGLRVSVHLSWAYVDLGPDSVLEPEVGLAAASGFAGRTDVTYLITAKDIISGAGMANCIGGVSDPPHSYAIGEYLDDCQAGRRLLCVPNATGRLFVHEVGHLLGAHHHQANCVEGAANPSSTGTPAPCSVMFTVLPTAFGFSLANAAVVRGHVAEFGSRNQGHARG